MLELPERIKYDLHKGNILSANIPIDRDGWYAWISIEPIMKCGYSFSAQLEEWTRTRIAKGRYDDRIEKFYFRYIELSDWHLAEEWSWDMDIAMEERPVTDWITEIEDIDLLIRLISFWLKDLNKLYRPHQVNYPWPPMNLTKQRRVEDIIKEIAV